MKLWTAGDKHLSRLQNSKKNFCKTERYIINKGKKVMWQE